MLVLCGCPYVPKVAKEHSKLLHSPFCSDFLIPALVKVIDQTNLLSFSLLQCVIDACSSKSTDQRSHHWYKMEEWLSLLCSEFNPGLLPMLCLAYLAHLMTCKQIQLVTALQLHSKSACDILSR